MVAIVLLTTYINHDYIIASISVGEDGGLSPAEDPGLEGEYNSENETLQITVTEENFTRKSGRVALRSQLDGDHTEISNRPPKSNFTLKSGNRTVENYIWADKSLLGIVIGGSGITNFPIEQGESITILSEGEDGDSDGNKGIENGDIIFLTSKDNGVNTVIETFEIQNNSVTQKWQNR